MSRPVRENIRSTTGRIIHFSGVRQSWAIAVICKKLYDEFLCFELEICSTCFCQIINGLYPEEQNEHTLIVAIASIAALLEKRSMIDKHPLDYPAGQYSDSKDISDDIMELYLKGWPEDSARFISKLALETSSIYKWCTRACVFLVVRWFADNNILPNWYKDWRIKLEKSSPDESKYIEKWSPVVHLFRND